MRSPVRRAPSATGRRASWRALRGVARTAGAAAGGFPEPGGGPLAAPAARSHSLPGHNGQMGNSEGSPRSAGSAGSILSIGSAGSILSIGSAGSILSIGSAGSILSVGSAGSVASAFSVFSAGSAASVLSALSRRSVLAWRSRQRRWPARPGSPRQAAAKRGAPRRVLARYGPGGMGRPGRNGRGRR
jgi:hypothetical protein